MPYAATTTGFPLYKGSYRTLGKMVPAGFKRNNGDHFIPFPIKEPNGEMKQVEYVQTILHLNPIVVGLCDNSDKVYSKPLYASPVYHYDGKPTYKSPRAGDAQDGRGGSRTDRLYDSPTP